MSSRPGSARALIAVSGIVACVIAALVAASGAGAATRGKTHRGLLQRCERVLFGEGRAPARALPGSADPQVAAELSIFRATRTSRDMLPQGRVLAQALAGAEATTYDPSASVRLHVGHTTSGPVYAVPATLATPSVPARCAHLRGLAGVRAAVALRTLETGTGPGFCLVTTQVIPAQSPVSILPGKRRRHTKGASLTVSAGCESLSVMASYLGAFGGGLQAVGFPVVLLPDGVSSVTYTYADGRQISAPVSGNVLSPPAALTRNARLGKAGRAELLRALAARAPTTVTENGADGAAVAAFARPPSLIPEIVRDVLALRRSFGAGTSSVGSASVDVACSARTHRCVAAVVSATCNLRRHRCTMSRRIARYRYAGRRPPRGTTGHVVVPTGPIRARLNRYVARPGKLRLALSGTPHHRVDVLVAVTCFSRHGGTSSGVGRSPLTVAVPSRTPLATVRRGRACGVDVLVISSQPGPIHARLVRG